MGINILDGDIQGFVEYVRNPMFSSSSAEETLFGPDAPRIEIPHWHGLPEVPQEVISPRTGGAGMTATDEQTLFLRFNYARCCLNRLLIGMRRKCSLIRRGKIMLWHGRAIQARNDLVRANMALVMAMAKRTRIPNVGFAELISEGNMALLRSVAKFDVSRGFKFSTYACRVILQSFNRLATTGCKYHKRFSTEFDPDLERSDYDAKKRETQHADLVDALRDALSRNRAKLTRVERTVISERFALNSGGKGGTLAQVGKMVGLSDDRVRQIQNHALGKLRKILDRENMAA